MLLLRKKLGERIRQLRKFNDWTLEELGSRANMEYQYIGAIERGEKNPTLDFIEKIATGLEIEVYQLFTFSFKNQSQEEKIIDDKIKNILGLCDIETKHLLLSIVQSAHELRRL